MSKTRCVVDTNVLISAVLNDRGLPARVVAHVIETGLLLASDETLSELRSRIVRPKFDAYQSTQNRERFIELVEARSLMIETASVITDSVDPDDNRFLVLAVDGQADAIVSGDRKHLLPLHPYRGIPILTPRDFAESLGLL